MYVWNNQYFWGIFLFTWNTRLFIYDDDGAQNMYEKVMVTSI